MLSRHGSCLCDGVGIGVGFWSNWMCLVSVLTHCPCTCSPQTWLTCAPIVPHIVLFDGGWSLALPMQLLDWPPCVTVRHKKVVQVKVCFQVVDSSQHTMMCIYSARPAAASLQFCHGQQACHCVFIAWPRVVLSWYFVEHVPINVQCVFAPVCMLAASHHLALYIVVLCLKQQACVNLGSQMQVMRAWLL